jgi:hypothetical protein
MQAPARFSKLPIREHCGLAGSIEDHTTGEAGMKGDAFHALAAVHYRPSEDRFQEARAIAMASISREAQDGVKEMAERLFADWTPPENAKFEVPIGIDRRGIAVPYDSDKAMVRGTADCVWMEEDTVVVIDFKSGARAPWNVPHPSVNLQVIGYGLAFADHHGKSKMRLGVYLAVEARWVWHEYDLGSAELTEHWERLRAAALRDPYEAVKGAHCNECWVRLGCRAYLLPAISDIERASAMAPMAAPVDGPIEPQRLVRLLTAVKAMEDLADAGKEFAKAYVARFGSIEADGKTWGPTPVNGSETVSIKSLKAAGVYDTALAMGAVRQGEPKVQHRWTNVKGAA